MHSNNKHCNFATNGIGGQLSCWTCYYLQWRNHHGYCICCRRNRILFWNRRIHGRCRNLFIHCDGCKRMYFNNECNNYSTGCYCCKFHRNKHFLYRWKCSCYDYCNRWNRYFNRNRHLRGYCRNLYLCGYRCERMFGICIGSCYGTFGVERNSKCNNHFVLRRKLSSYGDRFRRNRCLHRNRHLHCKCRNVVLYGNRCEWMFSIGICNYYSAIAIDSCCYRNNNIV